MKRLEKNLGIDDNNDNQERERERERQIQQLRSRIAELEAISNRTPAQKQELQEKKQELARLESQQQTGGGGDPKDPKKLNYVWL